MEDIIIRHIEEKDIPDVVDIQIHGWKTAYLGIIDDDVLNSMNRDESIEKRKKDYRENGFIVAKYHQQVVGFCRYSDRHPSIHMLSDVDCELLAIYVESHLKHHGIGTKLFQFVIDEFKKKIKQR